MTFERGPGRLRILIEGRPFATYVWDDAAVRRPFLVDVRSPRGVQVTRNFPPVEGKDATDHPTMHPGLWLAFGDLSGVDFWRNKGVVRHAGFVEEPAADAEGGHFSVTNVYESEGEEICRESCRIRIKITARGYLIDWRSEFRGVNAFSFGDQEEMGLGVRVATDMAVKQGGTILNSDGGRNEREVWGKQADWCDDSGREAGVLVMPDPANFRRSWFHARDYGFVAANPFGRKSFTGGEPSRVVVKPGEALTLRFGVLIHDGGVAPAAAYRAFLGSKD